MIRAVLVVPLVNAAVSSKASCVCSRFDNANLELFARAFASSTQRSDAKIAHRRGKFGVLYRIFRPEDNAHIALLCPEKSRNPRQLR